MLVAIEGIDGAGKQTQAALLAERAHSEGVSSAVLSFPRYGETFFAGAVEQLLGGRFGAANDPRLVGLLFAGDRFESRRAIEEALASAELVVADRYVASNLAYQAARAPAPERRAVMAWLEEVEHGVFGLPRPDLNVLIDLPVELARSRLAGRAAAGRPAADLYEADGGYLAACRSAYLELAASRPGWAVVAACGAGGRQLPPAAVAEAVRSAVLAALTALGERARPAPR